MNCRLKIFVALFLTMYAELHIVSQASVVQLRGAGASFPAEVYKNWMPLYKAYRQEHKNVNLSYSSVGSGNGKQKIQANVNIEYAGSDSVLSSTEIKEYPDLVLIPSMAGAVVMAYNIPTLSYRLRLTREQIVGIYNGTYKYWNESTFAESNPNTTFPDAKIIVVSRADKSGTTFAFTTALSYFSDSWRNTYGVFSKGFDHNTDKPYYWKDDVVTYFGEQNRGCSGLILSFKNSVGYLSVADALKAGIHFSSIKNKAGFYVGASVSAVQSAMNYYNDFNSGLVFDLSDSLAPDSYAMVSFTYFVVYKSIMSNCESAKELVRYIDWGLNSTEPRRLCQQLGFAPLSEQLVSRVRKDVLKVIACKGQNVWKMIQSDIALETVVDDPWLIPLAVTIPFVIIILSVMLGYILYQQAKVQQKINRNEWNIKIEDISFYFDGRSHTSSSKHDNTFPDEETIESMDQIETLNWVLQWPGKWKGHNVGLRLLEVRHFNIVTREMKKAMHSMKESIIHSNVLRFYGLTELDDSKYIIGDYCSKGQLTTVLQDWKYNLSNNMKISLAADIASGMAFLHNQGIIHGDLRTSCCLVDFRWTVKISDWEFCKLLTIQDPNCKPLQKLRAESFDQQVLAFRNFWTAPELIKSNFSIFPTQKTDVYSYSLIMHEIFSRQEPYTEHADLLMPTDVLEAILVNDLRPEHAEETPIFIRQIMEIAWSENTTSRPTFEQICKMIRSAHPSRKSMLDSMIEVMEEYTAHLENQICVKSSEADCSRIKIESMLRGSLPPSIALRFANGETSIVKTFSSIGIIIAQITGMNNIIDSLSNEEMYSTLQQICIDFDSLCLRYGAYREEFSVSDFCFTMVLGAETDKPLLLAQIGHMCFDLLNAANKIHLPSAPSSVDQTVTLKIAASIGNGVAGITGNKVPVYAVLGAAKDTAKELIKLSNPSHILVQKNLANNLKQYGFLCKICSVLLNGRYETCWLTGRTENSSRVTTDVKENSFRVTTDVKENSFRVTTDVKENSFRVTTDVKENSFRVTTDVKENSSRVTTDVKENGTTKTVSKTKDTRRNRISTTENIHNGKSKLRSLIKRAIHKKKMNETQNTGDKSNENMGFKIIDNTSSKLNMCTQGSNSPISFRSGKISPM